MSGVSKGSPLESTGFFTYIMCAIIEVSRLKDFVKCSTCYKATTTEIFRFILHFFGLYPKIAILLRKNTFIRELNISGRKIHLIV